MSGKTQTRRAAVVHFFVGGEVGHLMGSSRRKTCPFFQFGWFPIVFFSPRACTTRSAMGNHIRAVNEQNDWKGRPLAGF